MVAKAWAQREDLRIEFPLPSQVSIHDPNYTFVDWCREHGKEEMPEIFNSEYHYTPINEVPSFIVTLWRVIIGNLQKFGNWLSKK